MGGVAGVCLQVSCFVSCSLTAALLAVCLPLGSGAVCNYLESCQLCRLQRPKVNIIGPITKLIRFSVTAVGGASQRQHFSHGASLVGSPIHESMAPRPEATSQRRSCQLCLPDGASQLHFCHQSLPDGTPGQQHLPDRSPPRRPGQQQTSSDGEEYSGLASNLAHLGRIC